ncbi:hypothetical protein DB346_20945 [Verrucomicrobia bacterium LW23]|nr:hypothetical protein DB346_20945 [Verrucomicrobia bacterium LW23]
MTTPAQLILPIRPGTRSRRRAFTLVELMVSLVMMTLLLTLFFSMVVEISKVWQQAQARMEPRVSGRTVLDILGRELEMAALPEDRLMLYTSTTATPVGTAMNLQMLVNPPQLTAATFLNPHAVFWQAPAVSAQEGNMAELGYFIRWDTTTKPGNPRATLYRMCIKPGDAQYRIYSDPTAWLSDSIVDAAAPAIDAAAADNIYKGWMADNVIGLWVRCLDPLGNPITRTALATTYGPYVYDSRLGYSYTSGTKTMVCSGRTVSTSNYQILATLPPSMEVAIVILDAAAADRLTAKPTYPASATPTRASFWKDIDDFVAALPPQVRKGARIYSTRVTLKSGQ